MSKRAEYINDLIFKASKSEFLQVNGSHSMDALLDETEIFIRNVFGESSGYMKKLMEIVNLRETDRYKEEAAEIGRDRKGFWQVVEQLGQGAGFLAKLHTEKKQKLLNLLRTIEKEIKLKDSGIF